MLADRAEETASLLLPGGKRRGQEWCAGSTSGEAGNSLKVQLTGSRAGLWSDFATGEAGDLLDLWVAARGVDFVEALKQAKSHLGIADEHPPIRNAQPKKRYAKPELDRHEPLTTGGPVYDYLTQDRQLDPEVLHRYRIQQMGRVVVLPGFDPRGLAVDRVKYLGIDREADGKKKTWNSKDSRPRLWGWQSIPADARDVIITEGEIDAMTVAGWGYAALSVPMGVENFDWIGEDYDELARFDRIFICTDQDEPGEACAQKIAQRLGAERCPRIRLPAEFKDANAALTSRRYDGPDFEEAVAAAKTLDPAELRNAAEFGDEAWDALNPTAEAIGSETPWDVEWRIRPSEVTLWTGWSGHGKSHALDQVNLHDFATTGSRILVVSLEMPVAKLLLRMMRMARGGTPADRAETTALLDWLGQGFWFYDKVGVCPWRTFFPVLEYAVRRYGVRRIVIDSMLRCGIAEDDYEQQKDFVGQLVDLAARLGVHVHLVAHSRKGADESKPPGKMDIRGTSATTDLVHNGWSLWRNKANERAIEDERRASANGTVSAEKLRKANSTLTCWKNREGGVEPFTYLWLHTESQQFTDTEHRQAVRYFNTEARRG